jgi:hypothetical protein
MPPDFIPRRGKKEISPPTTAHVEELLSGKGIDMLREESQNVTFKDLPRKQPVIQKRKDEQGDLFPKRA